MPIYAYRCESCGFAKDVLQKMSDAPLTQCPECRADTFRKQVTAAGFQLKGSGWYVTDFRGGNTSKSDKNASKADDKNGTGETPAPAQTEGGKSNAAGAADSAASSASGSAAAAPAATPAASGGASGAGGTSSGT
jgi:putative FmdB family regulatory protein